MKLLLIFLASLFAEANAQYAEGNYAEAAESYRQVLVEQPSAEVYYNLGNACFKQGELSQSILAYERALRLRPLYKDAQYNLKFAQSRIVDNIEDTNSFFVSNWLKAVRNLLSEQTWMWLSVVLFLLTLTGAMLFAFSRVVWLRKTAFYTAVVALVISIAACANAGSLHKRDTLRAEAVITQGIVNAKSSPDRSGTDLFTLHEGTKVVIKEQLGNWCNIHVGNNIGWIPLTTLERI